MEENLDIFNILNCFNWWKKIISNFDWPILRHRRRAQGHGGYPGFLQIIKGICQINHGIYLFSGIFYILNEDIQFFLSMLEWQP